MLSLLLLVFSTFSAVAGPLDASLSGIASDKIQLIDEKSPYWDEESALYPSWARFLKISFLKYDPALQKKKLSEGCLAGQQDPIAYLKKCESELLTGQNDIVTNTYKTMMLNLSPREYPFGKFLLFQLPNGIQLKAFFLSKGDQKKRPLVIFRLGIFSNVAEFLPERYFLMQLFEQSHFNMLLLESTSSPEFIRRNKRIVFGGYDEGIQNMQVARLIRTALPEQIDTIHFMAVSMGGHGVLFASVLNNISKDKPIRSFTTFCPLINYRDTFDYHLEQGIVKWGIEYWASTRLQNVPDVIDGIDKNNFLPSLLLNMEKQYKGGATLDKDIDLPPEMKAFPENYWKLNNYWPYFKNIKTPVLILATQKDPIVPFMINAGRIIGGYTEITGPQISAYQLQEGYHCSLPGAYQWFPFADFLQKYIQSLSGKLNFQNHELSFALNPPIEKQALKLVFWEPHATVGSDKIVIKAFFSKDGEKSFWNYWGRDSQSFEIPVDQLDFSHAFAVINDSDAHMLERWVMQNIEPVIENKNIRFFWKTLN